MSEFSELYGENFFIIDSDNLDSIESKFYGFSIMDNIIIHEENFNDEVNLSGLGSYVYVKSDGDKISIYQDLNGSWGLYIYKERDYFAISNSFFKLVEYLKNNHNFSLNRDYADVLLVNGNSDLIFRQTLAKGIDTVPRNFIINIDKSHNYINYTKTDYKMHYLPLNSKEALEILDNWFYKWVGILRELKAKTNNIEFNLDGSISSRIILILMLCANIDLKKINISAKNEFSEDISDEDYEIVNKLAKKFNFDLTDNALPVEKTAFKDINTIVNLPFYIKGGFNNKLDYRFYRNAEPVYSFSAIASEMMGTDSSYYGKSFNEIYDGYINSKHDFDFSFVSSMDFMIRESLIEVSNKFDINNLKSTELFDLIVYETKCRNQFGKFSVIEYLTNKFLLSPFIDPDLHKLKFTTEKCDDKYLFYALVFTRYCPDLLKYDFTNDFEFIFDTIAYAREINKIHPFNINEFEYISGPDSINIQESDDLYKTRDVDNHIFNIFKLHSFEKEFKKYLPEKMYYNVIDSVEKHDDYPLINVYPIFYRLYLINCAKLDADFTFDVWIESFYEKNHSHQISSVIGLQNVLDSKANVSHSHDSFSKEQIKFLQKFIGGTLCKNITFDLVDNVVNRDGIIKIQNINVFDIEDKPQKIDSNKLYVILDDSFPIPFKDLKDNSSEGYYELQAFYLGVGEHKISLKYDESYGEEQLIFIKDEDNVFGPNIWLGSSYEENCEGFRSHRVESISSSNEWSDIGKSSVKVVCDGSFNYQALLTPTQKVNVGDFIEASVTVYNPELEVIVRLYESAVNDFIDIKVPASNEPSRVNISKFAKSHRMQLVIISRKKQMFYADNFVFTIK